ncbi:GGDEF domain-containing protein [Stutzerimonas stutzeri]|jgi:diguanylate cyclase (GGDEF)-like protein|nr:GGDEF domain-containing protein [Stutzerimonas stutzeri]
MPHTTDYSSTEGLRDTPYGRQLHAGFRLLCFKPALEREFRHYLDRHARASQRLAALLLILVVSGYLYCELRLFDLGGTGWLTTLTLLRGLQILPGVAVLVLTFYSRRFRAQANRVFPVLLVTVGILAALIDIRFEALQTELNFRYGAGLLIVSSFFFLGVTFWWALLCAVLIVLADVFMASLILPAERMPEHWIAVSYYVLLLIIGAISRYVHEYSQREQFLMRKLLGWVAEHDALSGLANRRSHDLALRQRVAQARRDRRPLSLLLLDLDDFKAYNDKFGHPAGDALIRTFGELLAGYARRPLDQAARVGGEEFALLLYNCDNAAAQRIARQLISALAALDIRHPQDAIARVGVSIGIATLQQGQQPEQLYHCADTALYQAKTSGKNRFAVAATQPRSDLPDR